MYCNQQNQQPPKVEAWGYLQPLEKFAVLQPLPYTAPTVTELQCRCEASELPMNAGTVDRQNSRSSAHFTNTITELKYVRCRNSRRMSELPTLKAFENQPLALSGMTRTVNSPSYLSVRRRNSRPLPELPTNQPENNNFTIAGQIPDTSGIQTSKKTGQLFCLSNTQNSHGLA